MTDIKINHQRTAAFTTCNGKDICQIELVSTKYRVSAKGKDKLKFHREGAENNAGFEVTIDPQIGAKATYPTATPNLNIDIPSGQAPGDYKYTIAYPNDVNATVAPLDPIIIIDPPFLKRIFRVIVAVFVAFVAGMAFDRYLLGA